jgi:hypothetical protein
MRGPFIRSNALGECSIESRLDRPLAARERVRRNESLNGREGDLHFDLKTRFPEEKGCFSAKCIARRDFGD